MPLMTIQQRILKIEALILETKDKRAEEERKMKALLLKSKEKATVSHTKIILYDMRIKRLYKDKGALEMSLNYVELNKKPNLLRIRLL